MVLPLMIAFTRPGGSIAMEETEIAKSSFSRQARNREVGQRVALSQQHGGIDGSGGGEESGSRGRRRRCAVPGCESRPMFFLRLSAGATPVNLCRRHDSLDVADVVSLVSCVSPAKPML